VQCYHIDSRDQDSPSYPTLPAGDKKIGLMPDAHTADSGAPGWYLVPGTRNDGKEGSISTGTMYLYQYWIMQADHLMTAKGHHSDQFIDLQA
jgi:hypothetical protein